MYIYNLYIYIYIYILSKHILYNKKIQTWKLIRIFYYVISLNLKSIYTLLNQNKYPKQYILKIHQICLYIYIYIYGRICLEYLINHYIQILINPFPIKETLLIKWIQPLHLTKWAMYYSLCPNLFVLFKKSNFLREHYLLFGLPYKNI